MKKNSFLKLALLLPALALAVSSCDSKQEPFLGADLWGYAMQVEDLAAPTRGTFVYTPDVRAYTFSTSDVLRWAMDKNGSASGLDGFSSPFRDAYETWIPRSYGDYKTSLTALNGEYSFNATNTEGKSVAQSFIWNFAGTGPANYLSFTESWGENVEAGERDAATHYTEFKYDDSNVVMATVKPFRNEGDGVSISYAIMYARYERVNGIDIGPDDNPITKPEAYRLSRVAGGFSEPVTPALAEVIDNVDVRLTLPIWNNSDNNYAQVALVAFKRVLNSDGVAGMVMMRTEYKTIIKDTGYFLEDAPDQGN